MADDAANQLFRQIEAVRGPLSEIDRQQVLKKPYAFSSRVHVSWILILSALAFVVGVVAPLFLLVWEVRANAIAETALLLAALALTIGPAAVFAFDVARKPDTKNYLETRWYAPLLNTLSLQNAKIVRGGEVDTEMFREAQGSPDFSRFPRAVRDALRGYIDAADKYNASADEWNEKTASNLRLDPRLMPAIVPPLEFRGGRVAHPSTSPRRTHWVFRVPHPSRLCFMRRVRV